MHIQVVLASITKSKMPSKRVLNAMKKAGSPAGKKITKSKMPSKRVLDAMKKR